MPLYEYKCEQCGDIFEVMQKFVDEPVKTHEKCGGKVERLISAPSLQFKGSGFYITDYGKGGGSKPAGDNGSSQKSDSNASKSSSGSDSGATSTPASTSSESKSSSSDSKTTTTKESKSSSADSK